MDNLTNSLPIFVGSSPFSAAPGSLGDLSSGGKTYPLPYPAASETESEAVPVGGVRFPLDPSPSEDESMLDS